MNSRVDKNRPLPKSSGFVVSNLNVIKFALVVVNRAYVQSVRAITVTDYAPKH